MSQISSVSTPAGVRLLRAASAAQALPRLGDGVNLFDAPPKAAGNSRLAMQVQGANISVRV